MNYLDQLAKFHKQHGTNLNRFPSVDKRPLDLYKLKKAVEIRGGFDAVCKTKKWAEIGRDLGYSGKIMSSLSTSLKNSYQRWLQPYEEYLRVAKPGVQQQLEMEHGGPFTPSPHQSPLNRKTLPIDSLPPPHQGTPVPTASVQNTPKPVEATPDKPTPEPAPRPIASGFTAVNASGGFTAVNQSPSFAAVNNGPPVKREPENGSAIPPGVADRTQSSTPVSNGHGDNGVKRGVSHDSASQTENGDDGGSGRRSKRLKKGGMLHSRVSRSYFPFLLFHPYKIMVVCYSYSDIYHCRCATDCCWLPYESLPPYSPSCTQERQWQQKRWRGASVQTYMRKLCFLADLHTEMRDLRQSR